MIYTCWHCGWRINERTSNSEGVAFRIRPDDDPNIGKYLLHKHMPFCSDYCITCFKELKGPMPQRPKQSDIYLNEWMAERKNKKKLQLNSK